MTKFFTIFLISAILLIDLHCKVEASANTTTTPTPTTKTPTPTTKTPTPTTKTPTPTTKTTTPTTTPKTPTTTTKAKTSTKMTPTTAAPPKVPRYVVKDNANKTCIILEGKISIRVQYMMTNNKTNLTEPFSPPENTNVTGACNNTTAEMKLEFKGQELSFYFTDKNKSMTMDHVQMKINPVGAYFPNAKNGTLQFNGTGLSEKVPDNTYYYCSIHDVILFSNTNTTVNMSIEELQAFNIDKDNVTGKGYLCERGREKPIPQPPSSPPQNKFSLKKDGKYCFFMQSSFQISVTYENNQTKNVTKLLSVPSFNSTGHSITGSCNTTWYSEKAQVLNFSFFNNRWSIEMTFSESALKSSSMLTADNSKYSLSEVKIKAYLDDTLFPDIMKSEPMEADVNVTMFEGNKEGAFQCKSNQTIVNGKLALYSSNLKYQAFTNSNTTKFAKDVTQCSADMETNSTVPIAVGAALAGLVVIVLIAYLIGRRRSRKSGYESV